MIKMLLRIMAVALAIGALGQLMFTSKSHADSTPTPIASNEPAG